MAKKKKIKTIPVYEEDAEEKYAKYVKYVEENLDEVVAKVTDFFDEKIMELSETILDMVRQKAANAIHYEWEYDGCPYDYSGIIEEKGMVDPDISIEEFLEDEYTGDKEATFCSGRGFHYNNFDDELSHDTLDLAEKVMRESVMYQLQEVFPDDAIDEKITDEVVWECHDAIYSNCPANEFFSCIGALGYCNVDIEMPLTVLLETGE